MKILASDLDGTLLQNEKISQKDIEAIERFMGYGNKFIISTGRSFCGMRKIFADYKIKYDYLVLCNGAVVLASDHNTLKKETINGEALQDIMSKHCKRDDVFVVLDDNENIIMAEDEFSPEKQFLIEYATKIVPFEEMFTHINDVVVLSISTKDESIEVLEEIKKEVLLSHGDVVEVFRNTYYLDIVPKGCSKGTGIENVLNSIDEEVEGFYAIGDSWNDIPMFNLADKSFTFNKVEEELKKHADKIVDSVHKCIEDIMGEVKWMDKLVKIFF